MAEGDGQYYEEFSKLYDGIEAAAHDIIAKIRFKHIDHGAIQGVASQAAADGCDRWTREQEGGLEPIEGGDNSDTETVNSGGSDSVEEGSQPIVEVQTGDESAGTDSNPQPSRAISEVPDL